MPSKASLAFAENAADVERLIEIHGDVGGDAKGRRYGLEVLNKSAIVLICAIWEAYCEDLVSEALEYLVDTSPEASHLPEDLRKTIAAEIKKKSHDLAVWELAGTGWKAYAKTRLAGLTTRRNTTLNTPKTTQIDDLFKSGIGLPKLSSSWKWKKMSSVQATKKLDDYITLRGSIAHRGATEAAVTKVQVTGFFNHVKTVADKSDEAVRRFLQTATGKAPW